MVIGENRGGFYAEVFQNEVIDFPATQSSPPVSWSPPESTPVENLQGGIWSIWPLSKGRFSSAHSATETLSQFNRAIGIFKRTVRRQRSFGTPSSHEQAGYVAYCVQKLLSRKSGHGTRLLVEVDLLTKE